MTEAIFIFALLTTALAIWKMKKKSLVSLDAQEKTFFQKNWDEEEAVVETDLKPAGYISVGKEKYQAVSDGPYIRKGEKVKVLTQRGETLIVRLKE